ncbi:hypothetical protein ACFSCW_04280 [Sphingomonas tabacisoli]|uniref:Tetratricopeptide repeat protein n=1 Tax=Sphingomonas tabacisoli TaxID=2249466 RepID=A0ABW4I1N0_9SPHN
MASRVVDKEVAHCVSIRCWGDFAIADAQTGAEVRPRGRKARALLAYLALHPGRAISREKLIGLLWGDRAEEQARGSLRQTLFELRSLSHGDNPLLQVDRETIAIDPDAVETEIDRMQALLDGGDFEGLLAALPQPDDTLFANLDGIDPAFDDWLRVERVRHHDELVAMLSDASAGAVAAGKSRLGRIFHGRLTELGERPEGDLRTEATPRQPAALLQPPARQAYWRAAAIPALLILTAGFAGSSVWWMSRPSSGAEALHQEAYGLYASARGMVRKRNAELRPAIEMLRRAVAIDPEFAPAWAELAIATGMGAEGQQALEAERHARRALAIDPNLADAHAALGMIAEFRGPEAFAHLKRAAELDPHNAQIQYWLSNYYANELDFGNRLAALRKTVAIDPFWPRGVNEAALAAWDMGYRDEAARYVQRLTQSDPAAAFDCDYKLDLAGGSYAAIAKGIAQKRQQEDFPAGADVKLGSVLLILGYSEPARLLLRLPKYQWEVAGNGPILPATFRRLEASSTIDPIIANHLLMIAMQRLLFEKRGAEIASAFDDGRGQIAMLASETADPSSLVEFAPDTALALRSIGRHKEASILLGKADTSVRKALARGPVPAHFLMMAAKLRAVQGRRDEALALLKTAADRGWRYAPLTPRPDLAGIYAFRELHGDPRFEAIRQEQLDHIDRERQAVGAVPV